MPRRAARTVLARSLAALALAAAALLAPAAPLRAGETFVSIGTGETNGLYYPIGRAICRVIGPALRQQGIRCSPESTPGSVYNVERLHSGELDLAIVQSDVQNAAANGLGAWAGKAAPGLRSVVALHPELVTIIARAGADIRGLDGLDGKRVNVGSQGTGTRATWDIIAEAMGRDADKVLLQDLRADETTAALCSGTIDANLLIVGHPSPLVSTQLSACPSNLVAISGPLVAGLLVSHPYYARGTIPARMYASNPETPTFGSRAILATSASVDPRVVGAIAKAILTHVPDLRTASPSLAGLRIEEMTRDLPAPLHPAAAAVYKELGLLR